MEVDRPGTAEQAALWREALGAVGQGLNGEVDRVASQFRLSARAIRAAGSEVLQKLAGQEIVRDLSTLLWDACRAQARPRLDDLAQRIETAGHLGRPGAARAAARDPARRSPRTCAAARWSTTAGASPREGARGLGISALFAGASGTGKTMAAEVLAGELRLDLYRIDLAPVVSKYIGETEKNLRRVFDAAEDGGAILLFDEADALFGKRSEVKDSHDRYANIEVSYLLQRMEAYRGLAILTTNLKGALDTAFLRRLRFVVQFPFPDAEQRAEIWRRVFPAATPTEGLDVDRLARLNARRRQHPQHRPQRRLPGRRRRRAGAAWGTSCGPRAASTPSWKSRSPKPRSEAGSERAPPDPATRNRAEGRGAGAPRLRARRPPWHRRSGPARARPAARPRRRSRGLASGHRGGPHRRRHLPPGAGRRGAAGRARGGADRVEGDEGVSAKVAPAPAVAPVVAKVTPAKPSLTAVPARRLQKKCACGGSGGDCEECKKKRLQRSAAGPGVSSVPPVVNNVLASPGRPLDAGTRSFLEPRFGHDFSRVRIHDDARAAESARAVNAHAYTVGEDIVFDSGRYDPGSRDGMHLLSHELAHTVQQSGLQRRAADLPMGGSMESQLEREADSAATAVLSGGLPGSPTRLATPHLSRKEATPVPPADTATASEEPVREWEDAPALKELGVSHQSKLKPGIAPTIRAYRFPMLTLPPEKGPVAELWKKSAQAGSLQSIVGVNGNPRSVLKQQRPGTDALQKIWLDKVKWSRAEAPKLWQAAGGAKAPSFEPKVGGQTCHMDHILELQIGGNNTTENMQVLDGPENVESGTAIFRNLKDKARKIRALVPTLKEIILQFDDVSQTSSTCGPCCKVEQKATASAGKGVSGAVGAGAAFEDYAIKAGSETRLEIPSGNLKPRKTLGVPLAESSSGQNKAASTLIPGMVLEHLRLKASGLDAVDSYLDTGNDKTRLPLTIAKEKKNQVALEVDAKTGELKLSAKSKQPKIAFTYPYLSKGSITELNYAPEGISGKGKLTPSIPFLSKMQLDIAFGPGRLEITGGLDPTKISPPIPGAKITRAELTMALFPEFKPSGALDFELAPGGKKMLDAALTVEKDDAGLVATGKLRAYIPGVDQAEGDFKYRYKEGWSGGITVESTQIKLPYVKSGTVTVGFSEKKGITAEGTVGLEVPGGHQAEVKLTRSSAGKWVYSGKGNFKIPKLKEARVALTYDGEKLDGEGEASFLLLGLDGKLKLFYSAKANGGDPKIWGDGEVVFVRGRAAGRLKVGLSPEQKFFGEGSLSYQVTDNLVATAGAVLDKDEKLRIKGGLKFPKPIPLFKPITGDKELFKAGITIPIPGASVGPVGLVVKIDGALGARYSIGPGELRNAYIESEVNPLEDKPDLDIQIGATLYVGASAGIYGSIRGAIAIDAKIASVSGGLTVTASADLSGKLEAVLLARYREGPLRPHRQFRALRRPDARPQARRRRHRRGRHRLVQHPHLQGLEPRLVQVRHRPQVRHEGQTLLRQRPAVQGPLDGRDRVDQARAPHPRHAGGNHETRHRQTGSAGMNGFSGSPAAEGRPRAGRPGQRRRAAGDLPAVQPRHAVPLAAAAGVGAEGGDRSQALRFKGPPVETIKLEAEIDADRPARVPTARTAVTVALGIAPQLAALETIIYPPSAALQANRQLARARARWRSRRWRAPLTLFVWSKSRIVPVQHHRIQHHRGGVRPGAQPDPRQGQPRACAC